ncbi:unnamed protein product [Rotaria magnacalcarata]|uniref:Aprataxin and PNK-like factor n=1 Tax=Rotaria magnacalcarata TaxID=392030 RepID=A0A816LBV7_9BILA|nr:unnamed protein product [Rotaria magnacalcarata]CAF4129356.1 unnamed protein product [Rotaria magnacalcarata]
MSCKIELTPVSEGNRIIVKINEKLIIGRGSSLGCNDKKISRHHAELLLKNDETLWIKPVHTNPVFYRALNGKTVHLTKDIEQELKDGDQIGLLPTSFFFRINFSNDVNNNKDEFFASSDQQSKNVLHEVKSSDVEPKPSIQDSDSSCLKSTKDQDESELLDSNKKPRKLPTWISASTSSSTVTKTTIRPDSTNQLDSSSRVRPIVKRQLSSEEDNNTSINGTPNISEPDKSSSKKSFDSDSKDGFDSISPKKTKSNDKRRPVCSYGATCYRKNPTHRSEQSHPGDSDYDDEEKTNNDNDKDDVDDDDDSSKPLCQYGNTCYRQNPQHKRDYRH